MNSISDELTRLVAERYGISTEGLHGETTLESLGIDSLGQIELMFDLEDHFKVRFGNHQDPLKTLQEVIDLIELCKKENAQ